MADVSETADDVAEQNLRNAQEQTKRELEKERRRVSDIRHWVMIMRIITVISWRKNAIREGRPVEDFQKDLLLKIKERKVAPKVTHTVTARVTERIEDDPNRGFRSIGQVL